MKIRKRAKLMQLFDLPPDLAGGVSSILINGGCELYVSSCKKILLYEDNEIRLKLSDSVLSVKGRDFVLRSFNNGSIKIKGKILGVERYD